MKDLNEWIATGTLASVEHEEYNEKPFLDVVLNSKNYKGENVQIPFTIWGKAQEEFSAKVGDMVAVKGGLGSKQNGDYLNPTVRVYSVEVLFGGGLEPAGEIDLNDEFQL